MKIIHISTQKTWGGGEKQIFSLMMELRKKNISQILVCPQGSVLSERSKISHFHVLEYRKHLFSFLNMQCKILQLTKNKADCILHAHDGKAHNFALFHALLNKKTPLIIHRRIVKNKIRFYSKIKFNHPSIRKIICISSAVLNSLKNNVQNSEKLALIPSGISTKISTITSDKRKSIRDEWGIDSKTKWILNIGSLVPQKQHIFFIELAAEFFNRHPKMLQDVNFSILGEGPLKNPLENLISEKKLSKKCLLLGFRKNSLEILQSADILLSTSTDEALGNVIMESFLTRIPVLASDSGGIPDLVENEVTGLLATPLDKEEFLKGLERLLISDDLCDRLKSNAFEKIKTFDIANTAESIYKVYLSTLSTDP